jgi:hypothetical protein
VVKSQDIFGEPISLNYNGCDTFKTIPGAILTIVTKVFLLGTFYVMVSYILEQSNWTMTDQTVVLDSNEFKEQINMGNYEQF